MSETFEKYVLKFSEKSKWPGKYVYTNYSVSERPYMYATGNPLNAMHFESEQAALTFAATFPNEGPNPDFAIEQKVYILTATVGEKPAEKDTRPHSRVCGIRPHDHGILCSPNCPTCKGQPL